jgi:hypothetical protein
MTDPSIAAKIHQSFNVHRNFPSQVTLDREFRNRTSQRFQLLFGQVLDHYAFSDTSFLTDLAGKRAADPEDILKCDDSVFPVWNIYTRYTRHTIFLVEIPTLTLALFVPGVLANYANHSFASNYAAIPADLFN